jgi:hypothetical protein
MNNEPKSDRHETNALRIVMQYFRGDTLVCELKSAEASLSVHVSRGDGDGNRDAGFRIEAHGKVVDKDVVIAASAPTRRAALTEVSSRWNAQRSELGLDLVNWEAVAFTLTSVRAIE